MLKATERQIGALSKVFAPWYLRWNNWARAHLEMNTASEMIARVQGMTQNDLATHSLRYEITRAAFDDVRRKARELGYENLTNKA